ncbi:hypothetical protein [Mesorhizobium sp.]|uniref:hypothetical protein n=1 Tax=Mesorhizobium sp. TaxID=1871066 RepID=UPI000FCC4767|nr:hypothetical protein [Mesorhizobium sp.]RUW28637.1 hypothetical protein EOA38_25205 [Mesorhizobium sp. M1E.F.Ca.ET.041.01.1.1]RWD90804.1 MAG: hypothetical protein EOS38_07145 [Mesorhizobium sp.]RWD92246.1 MAG: hypothetical protein EOS39_15730 [Mesorhizobium sp.]TIV55522.1 MAG: hypothetical protein E5V88_01330 [Mesorhizobium sp.]
MSTDAVVSRELKSLQEAVALSQQQRAAAAAPTNNGPTGAEPVHTADDEEWHADLRALADEVTLFFEEAEKNISQHPTSSVVGALLVGILIGRLLGRH